MASDAQQDRIETLTGALAQRDAALKIAHLTIDKLKLELSYRPSPRWHLPSATR